MYIDRWIENIVKVLVSISMNVLHDDLAFEQLRYCIDYPINILSFCQSLIISQDSHLHESKIQNSNRKLQNKLT